MRTLFLIFKNYQKSWKNIALISLIIFFISLFANMPLIIHAIQYLFIFKLNNIIQIILYLFIIFNILYLYFSLNIALIQNIQFKKLTLLKILKSFNFKTTIKIFYLYLIYLAIFSIGFVFPNLILSTIAEIINSNIFSLILIIIDILFMLASIIIINYISFTPYILMHKNNLTLIKALTISYKMTKTNFWQILLYRLFIISFNIILFSSILYLFVHFSPSIWFTSLKNQILTSKFIAFAIFTLFIYDFIIYYIYILFNINLYHIFYNKYKKI